MLLGVDPQVADRLGKTKLQATVPTPTTRILVGPRDPSWLLTTTTAQIPTRAGCSLALYPQRTKEVNSKAKTTKFPLGLRRKHKS